MRTTSKNTISNRKPDYPFLLRPAAKDYLWGGDKLNIEFGKNIDMSPLAETWECSAHPDGTSAVASGAYSGIGLDELIDKYPQILGTKYADGKRLPILAKFIDAKQNLSVQVHPDDGYANEYENGQLGKSEMWYIVDADKDSKIVFGFNRDMTESEVRKGLESGAIEKCLQRVRVKKNDVYFIDAGTVHAICAGSLIAEIQENSNLTYRLYDYNRTDKNGKKRELHIEKALSVMNYKSSACPRQPLRVLKYERGRASELLCRCKYFEVHRLLVNTETLRTRIDYKTDGLSFRLLMCIDGCGSIRYEADGETGLIDFYKGDTLFVPADCANFGLHGKARFLEVSC